MNMNSNLEINSKITLDELGDCLREHLTEKELAKWVIENLADSMSDPEIYIREIKRIINKYYEDI